MKTDKIPEETISASEEKYPFLFDSNRDSITIFRLDSEGNPEKFIEANLATTRLFGYTKKDLMSMSIKDIEVVSEKKRTKRIETLLSQGKIDFETIIKNKKGKNRNVEIETFLINYDDLPAVMNITRDITERKQYEVNTRKAQESLTTILEAIPDLLFEVGFDGRIYHFQTHRQDLLAVSPNEIMGKFFQDILPPDATETCFSAMKEANKKGWSTGKQYSLDLPQGKHWFELSVSPIKESSDKDKHYIFLARDVTDRKLADEKLRYEKERIKTILEMVGNPIFLKDNDHKITYANRPFFDLFELDENSVINKTLVENVPENERDHFLKIDRSVLDTGIPDCREEELTVNGLVHTIITSKTRFIDESGNKMLVCSIHDITERKLAEQKIFSSEHFLNQTQIIANLGSYSLDFSTGKWISSAVLDSIFGIEATYEKTIESWTEIIHPDWKSIMIDYLNNEVIEGKNNFNKEYKIIKIDSKEERWVHGMGEITFDEQDQPLQLIGTIQDITKRKLIEEKIKISEQNYLTLFNTSTDSIFIHDPKTGDILDVNETTIKTFGYNFKEEIVGHSIDELNTNIPPYTKKNALKYIKKTISEGNQTFEWLSRRKDGSFFWMEMRLKKILLDGEIRVLAVGRDITERKQVEKDLEENKEKLQVIFDSVSEAIYVMDETGTFIDVNKGAEKMYQYSKEELIGKTPLDVAAPGLNDLDEINRIIQSVFTNGNPISFEFWAVRKNGEIFPKEVVINKGKFSDKEVLIVTARDISARKKREKELRKTEEKLTSIFNLANSGIILADLNGNFLEFNDWWLKMVGYTAEEFGKLKNFGVTHPDDLENSQLWLNKIINGEIDKYKIEKRYIRKDKTIFWGESSVSAIKDKNNKITSTIGIVTDITERKATEEKLKLSLEKFQDLVNSTGGIVWEADAKTFTFNYVSQEAERLLGYPVEDWYKEGFWANHLHPDEKENTLEFCISKTNQMEQHDFIYRFRAKEGHYIWLRDIVSVVIEDDKPKWLRGVMFDITREKETNQSLLESEEKYRGLVENSPDAIVIYVDDKIAFINDEGVRMLDAKNSEEIIGKHVLQFIHPDSLANVIQRMEEVVMDNNASATVEERFINMNGVPLDVEIKAIPTIYNHKRGVQVIVHDITERKRTQNKIKQLSQAVEQSPVAIVITDTSGIIEYVNPKFIETTGYELDEVLGKTPRILKSGHTSDKEYKQLWETLTSGNEWFGEFHNKKKDGTLYWESASISPILNAQEKTTHYIAIKEDITERKHIEQQLIKAKDKAEESDRLKLAFLANMSHEIRTPMNGILGFTELLKEKDLTSDIQQEYIKIIEKSGKRMLNIINDIINISKVESGQIEVTLSETNVNEQIEYLHTFFTPEATQKNILFSLTKELSPKDNFIKTDREKIYAILTNLIKNALKFTNEGSIEFGCVKKGRHLEFFVKDTGLGISNLHKKIIFERFRQANESINRSHEGSGLGLAISKAYVEILGGKIWVESEEGKGSTFYFTIPYNTEFKPKEKNVAKKVDSGIKQLNTIKDLKVLIVEDDAISKLLITIAVKPYSREILKVSTGLEAIEACRNNPDIDLVMMDINMPKMSGYEATKQIRKFNKDLVIIAQTANGMQSDRDKTIAAGCTDYISKPVNITILGELIQKYFEK